MKTNQLCLLFFINFLCITSSISYAEQQSTADATISKIYQNLPKNISLEQKIEKISHNFMGKPYALGALGEGQNGYIDQSPLYRTDGFDCETYVSTVLGLSLADNLTDFKEKINHIRYINNHPSFISRNHFISLDWLPNNIKKGYVVDITNKIHDKNHHPFYKIAKATINKQSWLLHQTNSTLKIKQTKEKQQRLKQLHKQAINYPPKTATIRYLPLNKLFTKNKQPIAYIFNQLPNGSIIQIVRPNWQLKNKIGTNLNVSHLGFAIRKDDILYFREASSIALKVIDIPLTDYLKGYIDSPTVKGINVLKVKMPAKKITPNSVVKSEPNK